MNLESKQQLIRQQGGQQIVDMLEPFVTELRKSRIEKVLAGRLSSIQLAIEAPVDINNALAAVRSAEAFGISKVHLITPEGSAVHAVDITRGAIYWVEVVYHDSLAAFLQLMQKDNVQIAGAFPQAGITLAEVPITNSLCILIGNELRGLSSAAQTACNIQYKIPMVGMTESLNLSVSAAISLYELTLRKRAALGNLTDLSEMQYQDLKALYYLNSVSSRLAVGVIKRSQS